MAIYKKISLFLILLGISLCGGGTGASADVTVFSVGTNVPQSFFRPYEELYHETVTLVEYETADRMEKDILSGNSAVDLVLMPTIPYFLRQEEAYIYLPIQPDLVPNLSKVSDAFLAEFSKIDRTNTYGVPYIWGTYGIVWRKDLIAAQGDVPLPLDWDAIFDPVQLRHIASCGVLFPKQARIILFLAASYLNQGGDNISPARFKEVETLLKGLSPYVSDWVSTDEALAELTQGNACAAIVPTVDFATFRREELSLKSELQQGLRQQIQHLESLYEKDMANFADQEIAQKQRLGEEKAAKQKLQDQIDLERKRAAQNLISSDAAPPEQESEQQELAEPSLSAKLQEYQDERQAISEKMAERTAALEDIQAKKSAKTLSFRQEQEKLIAEIKALPETEIGFDVPQGPNILNLYVLAIPKQSRNIGSAHRLINYFLTPYNAARLTNQQRLPTTISEAHGLIDKENQKNSEIYPFSGNIEDLSLPPRLNNTTYRQISRVWSELMKLENVDEDTLLKNDLGTPIPIVKPAVQPHR